VDWVHKAAADKHFLGREFGGRNGSPKLEDKKWEVIAGMEVKILVGNVKINGKIGHFLILSFILPAAKII
jgi:hypothetical protein